MGDSVKLTEAQKHHLLAIEDVARSAYPGLRLRTLEALQMRGLARSVHMHGSVFSPQTAILWRITESGRAALTKDRPDAR